MQKLLDETNIFDYYLNSRNRFLNCFRANRAKGRGAKLKGLLRNLPYMPASCRFNFSFRTVKRPPWKQTGGCLSFTSSFYINSCSIQY